MRLLRPALILGLLWLVSPAAQAAKATAFASGKAASEALENTQIQRTGKLSYNG
jgi:hypothetical protein